MDKRVEQVDNLNQEKINQLKSSFDEIDVPTNLDLVITDAIRRGGKDMRRKSIKRSFLKAVAGLVAVAALFTVSINTIPAFAHSMSNLPIVGKIVKVLNFDKGSGIGGEITDGTKVQLGDLDKKGDQEILTINFMLEGDPTLVANYFEVTYRDYPYSMLFDIPGARGFSAGEIFQGITNSDLVRDIYRLITLDDSMERFVVTFKKPVEFEVIELTKPAQIMVKLKEHQKPPTLLPVYSLRSGSYPFGETVGVIEEILRFEANSSAARMIKDAAGTYFVEEGYYKTEEEALTRMEELMALQLLEADFYIEKRGAGDIPKAIK
jgi:hypothetical protein